MAEHEHDPKYRKALGEQLDNAPLPRRKPGAKSGEAQGTEVYRSGAEAPGPVRRVEQQMNFAPGPRGKILSQGFGAVPVSSREMFGAPVDLKKNSGTGKRFRDRKR